MACCDFAYERPATVGEALNLLAAREEARPLAGGQSLMPLLFSRRTTCGALVDLSDIDELGGLREEPDRLWVGAMCRQAALEQWLRLRPVNPMLAAVLPRLGPSAVRARGTVGGNLAVADPAGELLATAVAQDWRLHIESSDGIRAVPADAFVTAPYQTVLRRGDLLRVISVPAQQARGWAIETVRPSASARPLAGVAAEIALDAGCATSARVIAFATGVSPHRLAAVESSLVGESIESRVLDRAAREAHDAADAGDDGEAPAAWRRHAVARLTRRALRAAVARAGLEPGVRYV